MAAGEPLDRAEGGEGDVAEARPVGAVHRDARGSVLQVDGGDPPADHLRLAQNRVALRDEHLPVLALGSLEVDREETVARCLPVRQHVQRIADHLPLEDGIDPFGHGDEGGPLGLEILDVEIGARPPFRRDHHQVPSVRRQRDVDHLLRPAPLAEHLGVLHRVVAQPMEEEVPVVVLRPLRPLSRGRVAGVEEAAVVGQPGERAVARARDDVGALSPGADLDHPQRALLVAAGRDAVRQERAVLRREPPAERRSAVLAQSVGVHEHAVLPRAPLPDVEDRLVLRLLAPRVEVAPAPDLRRVEGADRQEVRQPALERADGGSGREQRMGVVVLGVDPAAHVVAAGILEPAVGVRDRDAVHLLDELLGAGGGWLLRRHLRASRFLAGCGDPRRGGQAAGKEGDDGRTPQRDRGKRSLGATRDHGIMVSCERDCDPPRARKGDCNL